MTERGLPMFPQTPDIIRRVLPYVIVVVFAWVGAGLAASETVRQVEQDGYERSLESCERGRNDIRIPLVNFANALVSEDETTADVSRAASQLAMSAAPDECLDVVDKP